MTLRSRGFWLSLAAITAVALALRVTSAGRIGVYRDEGQSMAIMSAPTLGGVIDFVRAHESHPPGYYVLGHVARKAGFPLGPTLFTMSLLASVLLTPLLMFVAGRAYGAVTGLLAGSLIALTPGLFLFTVQARPYAIIALLVLGGTACLASFAAGKSRRALIGWGLLMALGASLHYTVLLYIAAQAVVALTGLHRAGTLRARLRPFMTASLALAVALLPLVLLAASQMKYAGYEAVKPFSWSLPVLHMARLALDYPFEYAIPILTCAAGILILPWRSTKSESVDLKANPELLEAFVLRWVGVAFIALSFIGSYRSRLTLPHVMITSVPYTAILAATAIVGRWRTGRIIRAAAYAEVVVVLMALSWLFRIGYLKTNADLAARLVMASSRPSDLLVLMPGLLGASFNLSFDQRIPQIDFPYARPVHAFEFDRYFDRISDTSAFRRSVQLAQKTLAQGGAVWFVVQAGWHRDSVRRELALSPDSVSGIAQADVIRANQFRAELERLAGPADTIGTFARRQYGYETLNVLRYSTRPEVREIAQ